MNDRRLLGNLVIGGLINGIVIYLIYQIDDRVAKLYMFLVLLATLLVYNNQFFGGINAALSAIRRGVG